MPLTLHIPQRLQKTPCRAPGNRCILCIIQTLDYLLEHRRNWQSRDRRWHRSSFRPGRPVCCPFWNRKTFCGLLQFFNLDLNGLDRIRKNLILVHFTTTHYSRFDFVSVFLVENEIWRSYNLQLLWNSTTTRKGFSYFRSINNVYTVCFYTSDNFAAKQMNYTRNNKRIRHCTIIECSNS